MSNECIIDIEVKRSEYKIDDCAHRRIIIDQQLAMIKCRDCGELLDPLRYITDKAFEWKSFVRERNELAEEINNTKRLLAERKRCRCEHCGKMTKINGLRMAWR